MEGNQGIRLKKILSALFSLFVIAVIGVFCYFNQKFVLEQIDKVKGMYFIEKGDRAYQDEEMNDAIRFYSKGLSLFPGHYSAWYNLGNIYVVYEDYQSAMYAYSQAFKHNPRMMNARINYGIVASERLGNFDDAIEQYNNVINTKRKLITIPYVFDNKVSFKENKAIAYYNKGVTYKMKAVYTTDKVQKKIYYSKAIEAYENAVKINPDNYDAQFNLGLAYHWYGNYRKAGKCYCRAINLQPMSYDAHYNLAVLLRRLGHSEESYDEIIKAITLVTAFDENSSVQEYVAIVMNDITKNVYRTREQKAVFDKMTKGSEQNIEDENTKISQAQKKKNKKNNSIDILSSKGLNVVNGKEIGDVDTSMIEYFGKCPSIKYFAPSQKDFEYDYEE